MPCWILVIAFCPFQLFKHLNNRSPTHVHFLALPLPKLRVDMKTIILTRHAKSDWSNLHLSDFDRELNHRGLHDAPMMGKRLALRQVLPDLIIASTAKRAAQTAELIADNCQYDKETIQWDINLYHAPPSRIQEVIYAIPDSVQTVMIVCHNPGITDLVNSLAGTLCDNLPTCGMAAFSFEVSSWNEFNLAKKSLLFYDTPKMG